MSQLTFPRLLDAQQLLKRDRQSALAEMNAGRRLIRPEEVAAVAAYLASPEAADVNGQDLDVP